jgi:hypothetical protein
MRWLVVLLIALFCMTGTGRAAEPPAPLVLEGTIALKVAALATDPRDALARALASLGRAFMPRDS